MCFESIFFSFIVGITFSFFIICIFMWYSMKCEAVHENTFRNDSMNRWLSGSRDSYIMGSEIFNSINIFYQYDFFFFFFSFYFCLLCFQMWNVLKYLITFMCMIEKFIHFMIKIIIKKLFIQKCDSSINYW